MLEPSYRSIFDKRISASDFIHICWIAENIETCTEKVSLHFHKLFAAKIFLTMAEQSLTHSHFLPLDTQHWHNSVQSFQLQPHCTHTSGCHFKNSYHIRILLYWARYFHCVQGYTICCSVAKHTLYLEKI